MKIVSYNILAQAYTLPERYPGIPAALLASEQRWPALVRHIAGLTGDLICLQEVEPEVFRALEAALGPRGYQGHFAQKHARPDGCASFVRSAALPVQAVDVLRYNDGHAAEGRTPVSVGSRPAPQPRSGEDSGLGGRPASGHLALLLTVPWQGRPVVVANTHLKWDPPGTPPEQSWGYRQLRELLAWRSRQGPNGPAWVICGDFNATPDSALADELTRASWLDVYRERGHMRTCNTNRRARRIDYLWHTPELTARPVPLRSITDETTLPSADEPSDHVAIGGWFDWK